jgi:hypothetical protein
MAPEREGVVPGPLGGATLTAQEWFVVGLLGAALLAIIVVLLLPVGPLRHDLDGLPYKNYVGILIALVAGAVGSLGLGQYYDFRPGGPGWKNRPPAVRPGSSGIQSASSFEIYTPESVQRPKRP